VCAVYIYCFKSNSILYLSQKKISTNGGWSTLFLSSSLSDSLSLTCLSAWLWKTFTGVGLNRKKKNVQEGLQNGQRKLKKDGEVSLSNTHYYLLRFNSGISPCVLKSFKLSKNIGSGHSSQKNAELREKMPSFFLSTLIAFKAFNLLWKNFNLREAFWGLGLLVKV